MAFLPHKDELFVPHVGAFDAKSGPWSRNIELGSRCVNLRKIFSRKDVPRLFKGSTQLCDVGRTGEATLAVSWIREI